MLLSIFEQLITGIKQTSPVEFIAVIAGIASVWFSKKENILVYPVGLINTIIYIYISIKGKLFGEASVNLYYSIMSIYGWLLWNKKNETRTDVVLHITSSSKKEWLQQLTFFAVFYVVIYSCLSFLKNNFAPDAIPYADAFASATAYTGMWLMAKKKVESWYWWIVTDIVSIPLYFAKGYTFTSFQFAIFTIMATGGLLTWKKKLAA